MLSGSNNINFPFKVLLVPSLIVIILVTGAVFRQAMKVKAVNREINILEKEINKLESVNTSLLDNLDYYQTMNFLEREGRMSMGMKKAGENVAIVVAKEKEDVGSEEILDELAVTSLKIKAGNIEKWFYYFFRQDLL